MKDELTEILFHIEKRIHEWDQGAQGRDKTVLEALDELVREYTALWRGRLYSPRPLSREASALAGVLRRAVEDEIDEGRTLPEVLEFLKIVRASVKRHRKRDNPRAYLDFIRGFLS